MNEVNLAVEDINVTYDSGRGAVRALDQVSLTFRAGWLTLVMGPSGCGKTTLLSVLGCLLTPESGKAQDDRWVVDQGASKCHPLLFTSAQLVRPEPPSVS